MTLIRSGDWPAASSAYDDTPILNITATSYTPGTPEVGFYFAMPATNRVLVTIGGAARDNTNDNRVFMSAILYEVDVYGNKDPLYTPDVHLNGWGIGGSNADYMYASRSFLLDASGATIASPGDLIYAQFNYFAETTTSASADIAMREIMVEPVG